MLKSFFKNVAVLQAYFEDHLRVAASATNFDTGRILSYLVCFLLSNFFSGFLLYPEKNRDRVTQTPELYREHIYN